MLSDIYSVIYKMQCSFGIINSFTFKDFIENPDKFADAVLNGEFYQEPDKSEILKPDKMMDFLDSLALDFLNKNRKKQDN